VSVKGSLGGRWPAKESTRARSGTPRVPEEYGCLGFSEKNEKKGLGDVASGQSKELTA